MAKLEKSPDFGVLQDFVDSLFADAEEQTRLDIVVQAESLDLNPDLLEIVSLLPPGTYDRIKLCDQFNSSLSSHGWGYYYGAVPVSYTHLDVYKRQVHAFRERVLSGEALARSCDEPAR